MLVVLWDVVTIKFYLEVDDVKFCYFGVPLIYLPKYWLLAAA